MAGRPTRARTIGPSALDLRTRVALLCGALTALVAFGSELIVLQVVEGELLSEVDDELAQRSEAFQPVVAGLVVRDGSLMAGLEPIVGSRPARGRIGSGEVFDVGPAPTTEPRSAVGFDTVTVDGVSWRRFTTTVADGSEVGAAELVVELFEPLDPTLDRLATIEGRATLIALLASATGAVVGFLLGRSLTGPLGRLVAQAGSIGGDEPTVERIDAGGSTREVRELEATLNEMLDRIDRSRQQTEAALESARAFAADAAHELRTPLTSMATNIDILRRHPDLDPALRAQIVDELAEREAWLEQLLGSLRELTRSELAELAHPDELDLTEMADSALSGLGPFSPPDRVALLAEGQQPVRAAPDSIRILLDNLIRNAMSHGRSADGSLDLVVSVRSAPDGDPVVGADGGVSLIVDDAGPGIPEKDRLRVLERFERGPTDSPGTGLGLALVQQQVDLHRGRLVIGRSPAGGARIEVVLPCQPLPPENGGRNRPTGEPDS